MIPARGPVARQGAVYRQGVCDVQANGPPTCAALIATALVLSAGLAQAHRRGGARLDPGFAVGSHPYLHDNIVKDFFTNYKTYRNEQTYISKTITDITYWPDEWCILFKTHCVPSWPSRFWREPVLPPTARVVAFPGDPNPDDALEGVWPPGKTIKKIYKHILPTRWIGEIWDAAD